MLTVNSIEDHAIVSMNARLTNTQLKRVKRFVKENNPNKLKTGQVATSEISQLDLNLVMNYLSQNMPEKLNNRIKSHVTLSKDQAYVQLSILLPETPIGKYINLSAQLDINNDGEVLIDENVINISSLSIGRLDVADYIAQPMINYLHTEFQNTVSEYKLISESVHNIYFEEKLLGVSYVWDKRKAYSLKSKISSRVISDDLKRALIAQSNNLSKVSYDLGRRPSLNALLKPMFMLAQSRSLLNDPIIENKAVFITLGAYSLNKNIAKLFDDKIHKRIKTKNIYLKGRHDLSKHLLISAAITSMADSSLAESIGVEKEVNDSQGGSGFSFADLAADHAGIRLAEYAIENKKQARKIQLKLASIKYEGDYMPAINNLPEGLSKKEFSQGYENNSAYKTMDILIKKRINNLAIYN